MRVLLVALLLTAPGCDERPPSPGGGPRVITGIRLATRDNAASVRARTEVPLVVEALWAIPSRTDETARSRFTVTPADLGEVKAGAIFVAARPGRVTLTAVYQPKEHGFDQTFQSSLALDVTE